MRVEEAKDRRRRRGAFDLTLVMLRKTHKVLELEITILLEELNEGSFLHDPDRDRRQCQRHQRHILPGMQHGLGCPQKITRSKKARHAVKGIASAETRGYQSGFDIKNLPLNSEKEELMCRHDLLRTLHEHGFKRLIIRLEQPGY